MMETACFLTVNRDDLIDMTHRLIGAIGSGFFHDRDRPLLISMTGSFQSGKSLIVDTACEMLCGGRRVVDMNCITTRWQGAHEGAPVEIAMMDMCGWNPHEYQVLRTRATGGINFIQNAPHLNDESDIAICLEVLGAAPSNYPKGQQGYFTKAIEEAEKQNLLSGKFVRFASVRVNNEALLASPSFRAAFNAFAPQTGMIVAARLWTDTGERLTDIKRTLKSLPQILYANAHALKTDLLPVYGHKFPRQEFHP